MVLVGTIGTVVVGVCITIPGCIRVGAILILGILDTTVTVMVVGTTHGGVIVDTKDATVVIMDITETTTVTAVVGAITAEVIIHWVAMHSPETVIICRTTNVTSFPTSEEVI